MLSSPFDEGLISSGAHLINMKKPIIYAISNYEKHMHLHIEKSQKSFELIQSLLEKGLGYLEISVDTIFFETDENGTPTEKRVDITSDESLGRLINIDDTDRDIFFDIHVGQKELEIIVSAENSILKKIREWSKNFDFCLPPKMKKEEIKEGILCLLAGESPTGDGSGYTLLEIREFLNLNNIEGYFEENEESGNRLKELLIEMEKEGLLEERHFGEVLKGRVDYSIENPGTEFLKKKGDNRE